MKPLLLSICLVMFATVGAFAQPKPETSPASEKIDGEWEVSLFFSPDQPPSQTTMVITTLEDGTLEGTFYGAEITVGRVTNFEGAVIFTAVTEDGSGPYLHSGRLHGGKIEGQTLSTGRGFLMPWKARRVVGE